MSATPRPLAFRYTILEFNTLPLFARDTILELEAQNKAMREVCKDIVEVFNHWQAEDDPTTVLEWFSESVRKAKAALALAERGVTP